MTDEDIPLIYKITLILLFTIILWAFPIFAKEEIYNKEYVNFNIFENCLIAKPIILLPESKYIEQVLPEKIELKKVTNYGNGSCMPYARHRTGIQIYGSACTAFERAGDLGYSTTTKPIIGSMMVTTEGECGHVLAVEDINGDLITVSEQNYKGLYIVSERIIHKDKEYIKGYIY